MMQTVITIVAACVGSTALWQFLQFLLSRKDKKKDRQDGTAEDIKRIRNACAKLEKDACRTQMLVLMSDYPEERAEIMKLAQHYFQVLHGDWYLTGMFNRWLEENHMGRPEWFDPES